VIIHVHSVLGPGFLDIYRRAVVRTKSYLRATGKPVALFVNFASDKADYRRIALSPYPHSSPHPLSYT
jgi:hypothetical protein